MKNRHLILTLTTAVLCSSGTTWAGDDFAELPDEMRLVAVIRDFKACEDAGGHPDFQAFAGKTRVGLVQETLGADGKPLVKSLTGSRITVPYRDAEGRPINPAVFDSSRGDVAGELTECSDVRITSEDSFDLWYHDRPGVNMSRAVELTLRRKPGTDVYVFDSNTDPYFVQLGGFFPINGMMYGNYGHTNKNYHFTTELDTTFVHHSGSGHVFKFTGDDDVWVFIDGHLVIDLGSLHSVDEQYLDLDRLDWLVDGEEYSLKVFHAERRTTQSNFRIETTLPLKSMNQVTVNDNFD